MADHKTKPPPTSGETKAPPITPLRKKTLKGKVYTRSAEIEATLLELQALSREDVVERCKIEDRADAAYVPSECLVYLVRSCRGETSQDYFEQLYKILAQRVLRTLPMAENEGGTTVSFRRERFRENAFGKFAELLASDYTLYEEKLDYFEVRFDSALLKLRLDARRGFYRKEKIHEPIEDENTGELSAEVERAVGDFDPFDPGELDRAVYRSRLDAAINSLPEELRTIIQMIRQDIPIDSIDPDAVTIAKTLGKSEKTIRTYRDRAYAALYVALTKGEKP